MTRHTLRTELLLGAILVAPLAVAAPLDAAPEERIEVTAQQEPSAGTAEGDTAAAAPHDAVGLPVDEVVTVPVIEGAGGPHVGRHRPRYGGALVPLGEDAAHLEFVLDAASGTLSLHVLNGDASAPLPVPQEMVFLKLDAGDGEFAIVLFARPDDETAAPAGTTARYAAAHRRLVGASDFEAVVEGVTIDRQSYRRVRVSYPAGSE